MDRARRLERLLIDAVVDDILADPGVPVAVQMDDGREPLEATRDLGAQSLKRMKPSTVTGRSARRSKVLMRDTIRSQRALLSSRDTSSSRRSSSRPY